MESPEFISSIFSKISSNAIAGIWFIRSALFILFFLVINFILIKINLFKEKRGLSAVVSAIISLMSVWYLDKSQIIDYIIIPYSAIAMFVILILPLVIIVYALHKSNANPLARKIILGIYAVFAVWLWVKNKELFQESRLSVYITAILFAIVFFMDSQIHQLLQKSRT